MKRQRGLTLLELLVAVGVFAVMSVIAYRGLMSVAMTDGVLREQGEYFQRLQLAVVLMERDIRQAVPRGVRGPLGDARPALMGGRRGLALTRAGWPNPTAQARPTLQRIGYQFEDGALMRSSWSVLDRTQQSVPRLDPLVEELDSIQFGYLDPNGDWQDDWPPPAGVDDPNVGDPWPRAVRVALGSSRFGTISRVFALVSPANPVRRLGDVAIEESADAR